MAPTELPIRTLMHDPIYRLAIAWQNAGYNQPPRPDFYPGDGMKTRPSRTSAPPESLTNS
ncbi:hypothetical protein ACFWYW_49490 [Nonomuraea sp. NPDC059023]|uniref:rhamnogalacturonan lyase family protein n=1 Tax=unclassified Nonomuraea TaxID=2593643 RepID=UPI00367B5B09